MFPRSTLSTGLALALFLVPAAAMRLAAADTTAYPRITLSTWYEVDPAWPQRPDQCAWGQMPGVAVDTQDQVWICTRANPPVQVYAADGKFVRSWGEGLFGTKDGVPGAHQIRIDRQGNIWLVDVFGHKVLKTTPEGRVLLTLGTPGEAGCDEKHFDKPTDVAITPDGQVFVADGYGNARVAHFDATGKFVKAWGKLGTGPGEFSIVHSIVVDSQGRLYIADRNNARVQVFDQTGKFLAQWQNLLVPWGLAITAKDEIWVCGCSPMPWRETDVVLSCPPKDQVFMRFDTTGRLQQLWTAPKAADGQEKPGELNWLHGVALDSQGNLYAGDIMGRRAQKFVKH